MPPEPPEPPPPPSLEQLSVTITHANALSFTVRFVSRYPHGSRVVDVEWGVTVVSLYCAGGASTGFSPYEISVFVPSMTNRRG
jgi:hypothetical protein